MQPVRLSRLPQAAVSLTWALRRPRAGFANRHDCAGHDSEECVRERSRGAPGAPPGVSRARHASGKSAEHVQPHVVRAVLPCG